MSDKEFEFWQSFGRWLRSEGNGSMVSNTNDPVVGPSDELVGMASAFGDWGRSVETPIADRITDGGLQGGGGVILIMALMGVVAWQVGKFVAQLNLLGISFFFLLFGTIGYFLIAVWIQYVQPVIQCLS